MASTFFHSPYRPLFAAAFVGLVSMLGACGGSDDEVPSEQTASIGEAGPGPSAPRPEVAARQQGDDSGDDAADDGSGNSASAGETYGDFGEPMIADPNPDTQDFGNDLDAGMDTPQDAQAPTDAPQDDDSAPDA